MRTPEAQQAGVTWPNQVMKGEARPESSTEHGAIMAVSVLNGARHRSFGLRRTRFRQSASSAASGPHMTFKVANCDLKEKQLEMRY